MQCATLLNGMAASLFTKAYQEQLPNDLVMLGIIGGLLIGVPLIAYLLTGRRRWLAILGLNITYLAAFLVGGIWAALFAVLASGLTLVLMAVLLRHLYDDTTWAALTSEIRFALGQTRGFQIIEGGRVTVPDQEGPVLGPRTVFIRPYNAVIFERGARRTLITGPRVYHTAPFEYAARIFDLREREAWLVIDEVLSSDLLTVTAVVYVKYGIDIPQAVKLGDQPIRPLDRQIITFLDAEFLDWGQATRSAVEASVRQALGSMRLTDLLARATLHRLEGRILNLAQNRMAGWGIRIDNAIVQSVQPSAQVAAGMAERTRAALLEDTLRATANAYAAAIGSGMDRPEIYREVLRRTLEKIAEDPAAKFYFLPELQALFADLNQD